MSESQASELIQECSQATFGLGNKDLINKKVRDSYELDPSQIHFKHPEWQKQLDLLVKRVTKEMGCLDINITAKLHKILLYQKGSHFIRHRDTEKEKNMFGTLIIQLPSEYTGGEFVVYQGEQQKSFDFGQSTGKILFHLKKMI